MAERSDIGIANIGGAPVFNGTTIGKLYGAMPGPAAKQSPRPRADVGILTVLEQEMRAVINVLGTRQGYRTHRLGGDGPLAHEAELQLADDVLRVVALQTLDRGARSAALSYTALVTEYLPAIVLLVGIAGGISVNVRIGDVVFSDEVVYYDARRETSEGTRRRGQSQTIAAPLGHRLNEFFATVGDTVAASDGTRFHIHRGPIGTGDAVVTDENAEIRRWLRDFHEKVLAVETEAGGVAQAFHEVIHQDSPPRGWLTVRGISDDAGPGKGYADHQLASNHAAAAMMQLLPFLRFRSDPA